MFKIVHIPNSVLTAPTNPITTFDSKLKKLVFEMEETLIAQTDPEGVGLAATQIGQSLALFIMKPSSKQDTEVFINPKILKTSTKKAFLPKRKKKDEDDDDSVPLEGCLSIPRIWSPVERPDQVEIEYQDIDGKKYTATFKGFKAIIIQHEIDHLNGILFTQRALEQNSILYEEKNGELKKLEY